MTDDLDAVVAVADLVGRCGGKAFEIGYLDDTYPPRWWAQATFKGAKVTGQHPRDPEKAADRLAVKLLQGGLCTHCNQRINVTPEKGHWAGGECVQRRVGARWERQCSEAGES